MTLRILSIGTNDKNMKLFFLLAFSSSIFALVNCQTDVELKHVTKVCHSNIEYIFPTQFCGKNELSDNCEKYCVLEDEEIPQGCETFCYLKEQRIVTVEKCDTRIAEAREGGIPSTSNYLYVFAALLVPANIYCLVKFVKFVIQKLRRRNRTTNTTESEADNEKVDEVQVFIENTNKNEEHENYENPKTDAGRDLVQPQNDRVPD